MASPAHLPDAVLVAWARALESDEHKVSRSKELVELLRSYPDHAALAQQLLEFTYAGDKTQTPGIKAVVANLIFHADANPLDYLLKHAFSLPFELIWPTVAALRKREDDGVAMRVYDGGNLLHFYASVAEFGKLRLLLRHNQFHPEWINQTRDDGMTPLMVVWDTLLNQYSKPDQIWETTRLFLEAGADTGVVGSKGQTLTSLMDQVRQMHKRYIFDMEDADRDFVIGTMVSSQQQRDLEHNTPSPAPASGKVRF